MTVLSRSGDHYKSVITLFFIGLVISCSDDRTNERAVFKLMEDGFSTTDRNIKIHNEIKYQSLNNKLLDPITSYKAGIWYPKALEVQKHSINFYNKIHALKARVVVEKRLSQEILKNLFVSLREYKEKVYAIDSMITEIFSPILFPVLQLDLTAEGQQDFILNYGNISEEAGLALLSKIRSDISVAEYRLITFCDNKVAAIIENFETNSAIIAQDKSIFRTGEWIEITAGMAVFTVRPGTVICINGSDVPINESGIAVKSLQVESKPGSYSIPVDIIYNDKHGKKDSFRRVVKYTVESE